MRKRLLHEAVSNRLSESPALLILGPRGVGKTTLGKQFANTYLNLEIPSLRTLAQTQPDEILKGSEPVFIDEWHLAPEIIGGVRRSVDEDRTPNRFLLAGSEPESMPHSGAGRIARLVLRPMTLQERGVSDPGLLLSDLVVGLKPTLARHSLGLTDYARAITASGFPGFLGLSESVAQFELEGYLQILIASDTQAVGTEVRRPQLLRNWLAGYASSSGTIASLENIRSSSGLDQTEMPSKVTALNYLELMHRLFIVDPVEAFPAGATPLKRISGSPKHFLVDPGLSAALLRVSSQMLLNGFGANGDRLLLGQLFESLVALHLKTFASLTGTNLWHYREWDGRREVDFVLESRSGNRTLIEVKLSNPKTKDLAHINQLATKLGPDTQRLVITAGQQSYTTEDDVAVVPLGEIDFSA